MTKKQDNRAEGQTQKSAGISKRLPQIWSLQEQVTVGQVTAGQGTAGQVTAGQVTAGQGKAGQVTAGQVTAGQVYRYTLFYTAANVHSTAK